jgi:hypothetical protein
MVGNVPRQPLYQGRALEEWLGDLSNGNYRTQQMARTAIRAMGPAAVPFLTNSLAQRNAFSVRMLRKSILPRKLVSFAHRVIKVGTPVIESRNAAVALQELGPEAKDAVPALVAAVKEGMTTVSSPAASALGAIGSNAVPAIAEELGRANPKEVPSFLQAVAIIGTNAAPLAPKIAPMLEDKQLWPYARMALARIGGAAVPSITNILAGTNRTAKAHALECLAQIGVPATSATKMILSFVTNEDANLRLEARRAYSSTLPTREDSAPIWLEGLKDSDARSVELSIHLLTIYPSNVRVYSNEIAALATHPMNSIRETASNALTLTRSWPKK